MGSDEPLEVLGRPPTPDEEALVAHFAEMEKRSLEVLDAGARQIITLVTGLLGLFLGLLSLGDAPAYLAYGEVRGLGLVIVVAYGAALGCALAAVLPRPYTFRRHSLTQMQDRWEAMQRTKARWLNRASWAFGAGTLLLILLLADLLLFRL